MRLRPDLQDYDGDLNFATDVWSSPNHRAYVAITVHLEVDGVPLSFLLDIIEVAKVCSFDWACRASLLKECRSRTLGST